MKYKTVECECHPKHLLSLGYISEPFTCDGCSEIGVGNCYECTEGCDFQLHEECARPDKTTTHPFLPDCAFKFLTPANSAPIAANRICDACGTDVSGFMYACSEHKNRPHGHYMHPTCMKLKKTLVVDKLTFVLKDKAKSECIHCGYKVVFGKYTGWSYASEDDLYCVHIKCVKNMFLDSWTKRYLRNLRKSKDSINALSALEGGASPSGTAYITTTTAAATTHSGVSSTTTLTTLNPGILATTGLRRPKPNDSSSGKKVLEVLKLAAKFIAPILFGNSGGPGASSIIEAINSLKDPN